MLTLLSAIGPANEIAIDLDRPTADVTLSSASAVETAPRSQGDATRTRVQPSPTVRVRVTGASSADDVRVDDALAGFDRAGLTLPPVEIVFDEDRDRCNGHHGLFETRYEPWRLSICSDFPHVVTHELAHAWEAARLTDADRERYLAHRGLDVWIAADVEWRDRGVEDAAFIVQQNLTATRADLEMPRWIERVEAYEVLTGLRSPLRGDGPAPAIRAAG